LDLKVLTAVIVKSTVLRVRIEFDVSKEHIAFNFVVEKQARQETSIRNR
jgi:hypothetical protein